MYIGDIQNNLRRNLVRIHNIDYYPASIVDNNLDQLAESCVRWDEDDFEAMAKELTGTDAWEQYFNKDTISCALVEMIRKHDPIIGITWETVKYYLMEYCFIKDWKNKYDNNNILK